MARINVDDDLFTDPRFIELAIKLGDRELAIGIVINAWQLAQRYWVPDKKLIPIKIFDKLRASKIILDCGLATRKRGGIYLQGSSDQFAWLMRIHDLSRKGVESRNNLTTVRSPHGNPLSLSPSLDKVFINPVKGVDSITPKKLSREEIEEQKRKAIELFGN